MTVDDIVTLPGYPRYKSSNHVQTRLMFYYKPNCELCQAVDAFSARHRRRRRLRRRRRRSSSSSPYHHHRRRRRRQAEFDDSQRVVTHDILQDTLDAQT